MKKKHLFYHIPMSVSPTFLQTIQNIYGNDFVNLNLVPNYNIDDYNEITFLSGHFDNFSKIKNSFNDRNKIVFLRDPVNRFISQYYYFRANQTNADSPISKKCKELSIDEYINSFKKIGANHILNRQVCMLSNNGIGAAKIQFEQAINNLLLFDFIGISENKLSIPLLLYFLSFQPENKMIQPNIIENQYNISDELIQIIKKLNQYEVLLYQHACKLFNNQKDIVLESLLLNKNFTSLIAKPEGSKAYYLSNESSLINKKTNNTITNIYLHIGMPKTATTSIQRTLLYNKNLLMNNDFLYPTSVDHTTLIINKFRSSPESLPNNILEKLTPDEVKTKSENYYAEFCEEILNSKSSKIIISSEAIISLADSSIKELQKFLVKLMPKAKINIIISIRDFIDFTASNYQEWNKSVGGDINNYIDLRNTGLDNSVLLQRAINIFGKENITIYKFEDSLKHKYGPVGYFLNTIGLSNSQIERFEFHKENTGISNKAIALLHYINLHLPLISNGKISEGREKHDLEPIQLIRGEKYHLDKKTLSQIQEVTDREKSFVLKEFGIDYISNVHNYQTEENFAFDEKYLEDIITIFPQLTLTIKSLVYQYIIEKKRSIEDKAGKVVLGKIQRWIKENNAGIMPFDHKTNSFHNRIIDTIKSIF